MPEQTEGSLAQSLSLDNGNGESNIRHTTESEAREWPQPYENKEEFVRMRSEMVLDHQEVLQLQQILGEFADGGDLESEFLARMQTVLTVREQSGQTDDLPVAELSFSAQEYWVMFSRSQPGESTPVDAKNDLREKLFALALPYVMDSLSQSRLDIGHYSTTGETITEAQVGHDAVNSKNETLERIYLNPHLDNHLMDMLPDLHSYEYNVEYPDSIEEQVRGTLRGLAMRKDELNMLYSLAGDSVVATQRYSDRTRRENSRSQKEKGVPTLKERNSESLSRFKDHTFRVIRENASKRAKVLFSDLELSSEDYSAILSLIRSEDFPPNIELSEDMIYKIEALAFNHYFEGVREAIKHGNYVEGIGFTDYNTSMGGGADASTMRREAIEIIEGNPNLSTRSISLIPRIPRINRRR